MIRINPKTITKRLQPGDEVHTISISSPVNEEDRLLEGLDIFKSWGLSCVNRVKAGKHWGYLAGEDDVRYNDLHSANTPPLLAFAKGGWGSARLLERNQPWDKGWVLGYSDLSSVLLARLSAGFDGAIHGPLVNSIAKEPEWSKERLRSLLFNKSVPDLYGEPWSQGISKGPLIATNLTVASHLIGSQFMPDLKGAILILEDVEEAPYRIDRMLTQWRVNGLLQQLAGLAFGNFLNCTEEGTDTSQNFALTEILKERSLDLNIPVIANLPVGHCCGNAALPLGWEATLDGFKGRLSLEPSCKSTLPQ
ncbi:MULTISPECIES: S66 peptidase family protein [unclassified Prochlorococcus]|uniref:S66 peptidase family protein n=1 Tax=unclassified Prochlorococcus TaxID=2627481 RepID=UPI0005337422|nr:MULTISPECIES: LD-carboxypeptidase [unclassified Prochlorococcus]KGG16503.1 Muramoyltetrapeptide carboxypeptidase [Prochlorococcus sp. MIT 0602]KGG17022.1 Muramoyltetrapeptide carboxypeptidase [Prochlorococcus sp. MIT 0603]